MTSRTLAFATLAVVATLASSPGLARAGEPASPVFGQMTGLSMTSLPADALTPDGPPSEAMPFATASSLTALPQAAPPAPVPDGATTHDALLVDPSGDFLKGTQDVLVYGRYSSTAPFDRRNLYTVSASYGYYFWNRTSINPTVNLHYASHNGEDILGADFSLAIRHHFWVYERWSAFVEGDVGACFFDHRYPIGSSHFQFTAGGAVGMTYRLADNTYLLGGVRLDHYSNASIWGSDRHQSYNEVGVYLGLMWTF